MRPHERLSYSPIAGRPRLVLPGGARMVVWVIVNVEEWDIDQPMPRTVLTPPAGGQPSPDIPNWAWHEYGNRVGFWRTLEVFDQFKLPAVLAINGSCLKTYPQIAAAAQARDWEFLGHGFIQKNMQKVDDEAEAIRLTTEAIQQFSGKPPRGWLGPGLTETWETPDLLKEAGYDYVCDWVLDDQPVELKTRNGSTLTNIPYTQECNDVAMMLIQHHSAREYFERAMDQFDQLYEDSRDSARVMALVVHPYIMGVPHRLKWFRKIFERLSARKDVLFWTGSQIVDWHRSEQARLAVEAGATGAAGA
jgi:peptidoglycan/xylan/chitin deacetylase (PgdA/CDA1 family)